MFLSAVYVVAARQPVVVRDGEFAFDSDAFFDALDRWREKKRAVLPSDVPAWLAKVNAFQVSATELMVYGAGPKRVSPGEVATDGEATNDGQSPLAPSWNDPPREVAVAVRQVALCRVLEELQAGSETDPSVVAAFHQCRDTLPEIAANAAVVEPLVFGGDGLAFEPRSFLRRCLQLASGQGVLTDPN
jgi:hypothetical protein